MLTTQVQELTAATRLDNVRYAIRDLAVLADQVAKQGKPVLMLNIGDPLLYDFQTPPHLIEAVYKAMKDGKNGYGPSSGAPEALEAIRADAERKNIGNIQDIFVASGVSEGLELAFAALLNPGEDVLCPNPEYPLYSAVLAKLGCSMTSYMLRESRNWEPDLQDMARNITPRTRAIVVNSPNNPTGAVYSRRTLEGMAELARRNNLVIFADEIYDRLIFEGERISIASVAPDVPVITFNGMSKGFLAPGWRLGWAVCSGPESMKPYIEGINKLLRSRLCANHPEQYAIKPALEGPQDYLPEVLDKLRRRRDLTLKWCNSTPRVSCVPPQAAFYAYPKFEIPEPDQDFVKKLLIENQVLVVHGSGFGQEPGTRHVRIVYLPDEQNLTRAYAGITDFMQRHYR